MLHSTSGEQGEIIIRLQNQVGETTANYLQKSNALEQLTSDLQTAKNTIARLQFAESETAKLRQDVQSLSANLQTANSTIADLTEKLEKAKKKATGLQQQKEQPARTQRQEADGDKITSLEKARAKNRMPHAEVLAFMQKHPNLTRAEVAAKLEISERKVYDAIAWQKEQEQENAVVSQ